MKALVFASTLVALLLAPSTVDAGKLVPKCAGKNYTVQVGFKHNYPPVSVTSLAYTAAAIEIECLAFEVIPPPPGTPLHVQTDAAHDKCTREYFEAENPFSLFLEAKTVGSGKTTRWDLDDILGGSVDKLRYWNDDASTWSVYFENRDHARCPMQLNAMILTNALPDKAHVHPSPGLVMVDPATIYTNRTALLGFNVIGGPADGDKVRLRPDYDPSRNDQWHHLTRVTDNKVLSRHQLFNASLTAAFHFESPKGGNYLVEYMRSTGNTKDVYVAIAHLIVYGGNPAFFKITKGAGPDGELYLGRQTTFSFYGDHLNTNNHGDQVKFVNYTRQCSEGAPDFGKVGSKNLGPGDESDTTRADWNFKLRTAGSIRVCYKTKVSGIWGEVVSYDDLDHLGPATNAPQGSIPVPTSVNGHPCKLAPPSANPTDTKTDVLMTLRGGDNFQHHMITKLGAVLCIDPKAIQVLFVQTKDDVTQVAIDIVCHKYGQAFQCLGTERKDMMLFMWSNKYLKRELTELGITDVVSQKRGARVNTEYTYPTDQADRPKPSAGHSALVIIFILLIFAGVFAMGWVFRDKIQGGIAQGRHQFMQIGTVEDGDGDDDDDKHNAPHAANPGSVGQRAARSVTRDSTAAGEDLSERP